MGRWFRVGEHFCLGPVPGPEQKVKSERKEAPMKTKSDTFVDRP